MCAQSSWLCLQSNLMRESNCNRLSSPLQGAHLLAVEDDFLVLLDVASALREAGAPVVRTCGTVQAALDLVEAEFFSAAVLDVRLGRDTVAPVACRLTKLRTPFVFYTGQLTTEPTVAQWPNAPVVSKPAPPAVLVDAVVDVLRTRPRPAGLTDELGSRRAALL